MKVGDLVIPSAFSNYKEVYPAKMIVEVIESERNGKVVKLYLLEGEEATRREETLILVSDA
jgi:hypothetical protein